MSASTVSPFTLFNLVLFGLLPALAIAAMWEHMHPAMRAICVLLSLALIGVPVLLMWARA